VGTLRGMMHQNDVTPKTHLDELTDRENMYGLGAVAYLQGEILILAGEPIIAIPKGDSAVQLHADLETGACLMVATRVKEWAELTIPETITSQTDLEAFIAASAKNMGLSPTKAFPFRLEGRFKTLDWHVVNWDSGDTEHSHEKHITSGPHGTLTEADASLLGFYSTRHTGIFTHYDSDVHMHMVLQDRSLAGHVDGYIPGELTLYLPAS